MPILRIVAGADAGQEYLLTDGLIAIGRDAAAEVRIGDRKSSRLHARIGPVAGGGWEVIDLGSSNGTWNGDSRITRLTLVNGAEFRIGATVLRFEDASAPPAQPRIEGLDPTSSQLFPESGLSSVAASELQKARVFLSLLHRIVMRSHVARTRDELFEVLDDTAAEVLEGDRCAVFLPAAEATAGEAGWELWPTHARRLKARFGAVPFARTLLAAVRTRREPLLSAGGGDLAPTASMMRAGVRSAMAAPLRIGDEVHAVLYVDRLAGSQAFSRVELEFLAAVANQLAVQLTNRAHVAALESAVERLEIQPVRTAPPALIGTDPAIRAVRTLVERTASSDLPALIVGDPGTGKELVARHLHHASQRTDRPLQVVSCAALGTKAGQALFGTAERPGAIEMAHQGTLLVGEVGELSAPWQTRLAAVLNQGAVCREGEATPRTVDVRLIATTSQTLEALVPELRGRLSALTVALPPLTARGTDIDALAEGFLHVNATRFDHPLKRLAPETRTALLRHPWPGNVQELKDALERACVLADDQIIRLEHLPDNLRVATSPDISSASMPIIPLGEVERQHILRVLAHCGGNKKAAAEILAIDRSTLYAKLKQYGVA